MSSPKKQIATFLCLTFAISWLEDYFVTQTNGVSSALLVLLVMWTPGLVGISLSLYFGWSLKDIGFRFAGWRFWAVAYATPALAAIVIALALLIFRIDDFQLSPSLIQEKGGTGKALFSILLLAPLLNGLISFGATLGEEIGWRGFLQSRMLDAKIRHPFLLTGLIWAVWHWPLILFAGYASSPIPAVSICLFTIMVACQGIFLGWLRGSSGSIFTVALAHGTHNLWIQGLTPAFLKKGPLDPYFGGESGLFIVLIYLTIAVTLFRTRREGLRASS